MSVPGERELGLILTRADHLLSAANAFAFSLEEIHGIDLPPVSPVDVDQAQLRAIASLYLASELENAGVIPAAEALTRLAMSGSLNVNLGSAAGFIETFWRGRNSRASDAERMSFFAALFGTSAGPNDSARGRNSEFEDLLIDLCEALYRLDEQASNPSWGSVAQQTRVRTSSQHLLSNILHVSGGITVFMGKEILQLIRDTLAILGHPAVKAAFHAQSVWDVIDEIDRRMRQPLKEHSLFVRRGQAGMTILAWLADAAPLLSSNKPLVGLDHPVIPAAVDWLEASLSLGQTVESSAPASDEPSWAELAG
jgi:hypothetical protein